MCVYIKADDSIYYRYYAITKHNFLF